MTRYRKIRMAFLFVIAIGLPAPVHAVTLPGGEPNPSNANLRLWLKADAGTTGTTNVTAWTDQSAAGNSFTATTGPELIASVAGLNSNPALRFNGTDEFLSGPAGIFNSADSTTFIVAQAKSPGANNFRFLIDTNTARHTVYFDNRGGANQGFGINYDGGNSANPAFVYDDGYDLLSTVVAGGTGTTQINGANPVSAAQSGGTNGTPFHIGTRFSAGAALNHFNADLAEVLIYNDNLTSFEQNQVGDYLEDKYGLVTDFQDINVITNLTKTGGDTADPRPDVGIQGLVPGALSYVDRTTATWDVIPTELLGADYVLTENDDKDSSGEQYGVTVGERAELFVLVADRLGTVGQSTGNLEWLNDGSAGTIFELTDLVVTQGFSPFGDFDFNVWRSLVLPGAYTLGNQDGASMYGIAAVAAPVPEPVHATAALLGLFGLVQLRRRRIA